MIYLIRNAFTTIKYIFHLLYSFIEMLLAWDLSILQTDSSICSLIIGSISICSCVCLYVNLKRCSAIWNWHKKHKIFEKSNQVSNLPQITLFAVARGTGLKIPPQYLLLSPAEPSQLLPDAKKSKQDSINWDPSPRNYS